MQKTDVAVRLPYEQSGPFLAEREKRPRLCFGFVNIATGRARHNQMCRAGDGILLDAGVCDRSPQLAGMKPIREIVEQPVAKTRVQRGSPGIHCVLGTSTGLMFDELIDDLLACLEAVARK